MLANQSAMRCVPRTDAVVLAARQRDCVDAALRTYNLKGVAFHSFADGPDDCVGRSVKLISKDEVFLIRSDLYAER